MLKSSLVVFLALLAVPVIVCGQTKAPPPALEGMEKYEDAPALVWRTGESPRMISQFGPFTSFQVNVGANGLNITGDAGNEPSICVDPTNPNRMAIGWRQFNSVASNFRQSGYGYTSNGGTTWTFGSRKGYRPAYPHRPLFSQLGAGAWEVGSPRAQKKTGCDSVVLDDTARLVPFRSLGLDDRIFKAIQEAGYTEPTPIQAAAIPEILAGKDVIGIAQTGTGKTAAFV